VADPNTQAYGGASVANTWIVDGEAAATLQCVLEGGSTRDLAEIDPEAQFREPSRESNSEDAVGQRIVVRQGGVPGG
jgi:hypothetical protein